MADQDVTDQRLKGLERRMSEQETEAKDLQAYKNSHEGQIQAWWSAQHEWNAKIEVRNRTADTAISEIQKKLMWITGASAVVGSGLGGLITRGFS